MPEQQQPTQAEVKVTTTAPVKFGFGQIFKPTPEAATWIFRTVLYTAFVVNIVCQTVSEIPQSVKDIVGRYSIEAVTLVHMLSKLFGVEVKGPQ